MYYYVKCVFKNYIALIYTFTKYFTHVWMVVISKLFVEFKYRLLRLCVLLNFSAITNNIICILVFFVINIFRPLPTRSVISILYVWLCFCIKFVCVERHRHIRLQLISRHVILYFISLTNYKIRFSFYLCWSSLRKWFSKLFRDKVKFND